MLRAIEHEFFLPHNKHECHFSLSFNFLIQNTSENAAQIFQLEFIQYKYNWLFLIFYLIYLHTFDAPFGLVSICSRLTLMN